MALQKKSDRQKVSDEWEKIAEEKKRRREDTEIVIELGLTTSQFETLRWVLICWLGQYGTNEFSKYKDDVEAISAALESAV